MLQRPPSALSFASAVPHCRGVNEVFHKVSVALSAQQTKHLSWILVGGAASTWQRRRAIRKMLRARSKRQRFASEPVRLELFKSGNRLERDLLPFLKDKACEALGAVRVNLPNKARGQAQELLAAARLLLGKVGGADVCLHYSLKNMPAGVGPFRDFLLEAADTGVQRVLLVSGTGKKPRQDAVRCLKELAEESSERQVLLPRIGVAFTPFEEPQTEQARFKDKLSTGLVHEVWLQIGSDLLALRQALEFLRDAAPGITTYGSVFIPSPELLKRMRERPWKGVDLTPNGYLESLQSAEEVTHQILDLYSEFGVVPLIESPVESPAALSRALEVLSGASGESPSHGVLSSRLQQGDEVAPQDLSGLAVMWFRVDLRIHDNPALTAAARHQKLLPLYIGPEESSGGAAQVWLKESLKVLSASLETMGSKLCFRRGEYAKELLMLCERLQVQAVYFNRRYEPWMQEADNDLAQQLRDAGISVQSFASYLLYEPDSISMAKGFHHGHWGTLLPFLGACAKVGPPRKPLPKPAELPGFPEEASPASALSPLSQSLENLGLAEISPSIRRDWRVPICEAWQFGEDAALVQMHEFVSGSRLPDYEKQRSRADLEENPNSRLSPYLRWGQLSPNDLYWAIQARGLPATEVKTFQRRLFWRDLAYFHYKAFPTMRREPIRAHYKDMRWRKDQGLLKKWQRGATGFPLVDASMRELWQTGWSQQNMRMVAASFLVEYCNLDWVLGAEWYEDTLVDADVAINSMMWQNAGRSGIDQWNFVISPAGGSQDPSGAYVRRWVPELANLPTRYLHKPWEAPLEILRAAGVTLGETYPKRCIPDLEGARKSSAQAVIDMRRNIMNTDWNDRDGYDVIQLPTGTLTKVFTRREFRLPTSTRPMRLSSRAQSKSRSPRRRGGRKSPTKVSRRALGQSSTNWVLRHASRMTIDLDD